jgi:hypothetical protein
MAEYYTVLPLCGLLLRAHCYAYSQRDDECEQDSRDDDDAFPSPPSRAFLVPYMAKLLRVLVTPNADAQGTAVGCPVFTAFTWCIQPAASQHRHHTVLLCGFLDMLDVLMFWVVAVCARGSDVDLALALGGGRATPSSLCRFNDEREALTGRRRYAFGRAVLVIERFVGRVSVGAKDVHVCNGKTGDGAGWVQGFSYQYLRS